jgi:tRNA (guanine26-N2/guanine27-N2)-dimethyltransferase
MMEQQRTEGRTGFWTDSKERITRDMPVFYNPVMKLNRDMTLAMLLTMKNDVRIALPMEASGLRAARILHELVAPGHLNPALIAVNDLSEHAIDFAKRNIAHNIGSFDSSRVEVTRMDASEFLLRGGGFEYIDIDPFGTPNPFIDAAVRRVSRSGIIAVTATDTAALSGTYPSATAKKYWAAGSRTWVMHEVGLRILIRKVQLIAAQYDKALVPVLSLATDHYYRVFFEHLRSDAAVKDVLAKHRFLIVDQKSLLLRVSRTNDAPEGAHAAGPLWTGPLHDVERVRSMRAALSKLDAETAAQLDKLLAIVEDECKIDSVGFIDLHELASCMGGQALRTDVVLEKLGNHACRTHINGHSVKTDLDMDEFRKRIS